MLHSPALFTTLDSLGLLGSFSPCLLVSVSEMEEQSGKSASSAVSIHLWNEDSDIEVMTADSENYQ